MFDSCIFAQNVATVERKCSLKVFQALARGKTYKARDQGGKERGCLNFAQFLLFCRAEKSLEFINFVNC